MCGLRSNSTKYNTSTHDTGIAMEVNVKECLLQWTKARTCSHTHTHTHTHTCEGSTLILPAAVYACM